MFSFVNFCIWIKFPFLGVGEVSITIAVTVLYHQPYNRVEYKCEYCAIITEWYEVL